MSDYWDSILTPYPGEYSQAIKVEDATGRVRWKVVLANGRLTRGRYVRPFRFRWWAERAARKENRRRARDEWKVVAS